MEHTPVEVVVRMIPTLFTVDPKISFTHRHEDVTSAHRRVSDVSGRAPRYHGNAYRTHESVFIFIFINNQTKYCP